ncbi:MAG: MFS transporter [Rhodospirillales bacterium]|nr:MFS transporter [Rhodospirillales bacterium]
MRRDLQTLFVNVGHFVDHLYMLIFPTAVLAMGPAFGASWNELLQLSFGGFVAFGACSLPAGWLGDRWSRWGMMVVFFVGIGVATCLVGLAQSTTQLFLALTLIGVFGAIYHPVGIAMIVADPARLGRALGVNGVWGNLGLAFAALVAGALVEVAGWRAAFLVPGVVAIVLGIAFAVFVPRDASGTKRSARGIRLSRSVMIRVFAVLLVATSMGGVIFNGLTVSMPKIFAERITALGGWTLGIGALVCLVYVFAAVAQLIVGRFIDRYPLRSVFIPVTVAQAPLLLLAVSLEGWPLVAVSLALMFVVFGQIPINDAIVARYTDAGWRSRVYALRYVVSFGASSLAVPMVATLHGGTGFAPVFLALAAMGAATALAALFFPAVAREERVPPVDTAAPVARAG